MAGIIQRYASYLPVYERTPRLSLHEGNTPLIHAPKISEELRKKVVCVLTGNGLKEPDIALKAVGTRPLVVESTIESVMSVIKR